jgi:predicted RNase H-like HicB family nuclease
MREYVVIIEKSTNCWSAYAPDLPGLGVTADTPEEAEKLIREGVGYHLEALLENGDVIPEPATRVAVVCTDVVEAWPQHLAKTA